MWRYNILNLVIRGLGEFLCVFIDTDFKVLS